MDENTANAHEAATVTGRDDYIKLKAMLYAIATMQSLLSDESNDCEYGDLADMRALARAMAREMLRGDATHDTPILFSNAMLEVHRRTGQMPDLWPNPFGEELREIYAPHELALRGAFFVTIENMKKDMAAFLAKLNCDNGVGFGEAA